MYQSGMELCEELLPGIEAFLVYTLAAEHLSQAAEQQRRYYVDCFAKTKSQLTSSIVEHRALDEENVYDPVDDTQNGSSEVENIYEVPIADDDEVASDSDTSYESYDDETFSNDNENIYVNAVQLNGYVKLRGMSKLRQAEASSLHTVSKCGELFVKKLLSWKRHMCYVSEGCLLCYTSHTNTPRIVLPLLGYDIAYVERDGRRTNVIHISHAGCGSVLLAAHSRHAALTWISYLRAAAAGDEMPADDSVCAQQSGSSRTSSVTSLSTSASVDTKSLNGDKARRNAAVDARKTLSALSGLLQTTFGRKQGRKASRDLDLASVDLGTDVTISGVLNVSECASKLKWRKCVCAVRDGYFIIFHKLSPVLSLPMCHLDIQPASQDTKRSLAVKLHASNKQSVYIEPLDIIEHGRWLSVLIREVGKATTTQDVCEEAEIPGPVDMGDTGDTYGDTGIGTVDTGDTVSDTGSNKLCDTGNLYDDIELELKQRHWTGTSDVSTLNASSVSRQPVAMVTVKSNQQEMSNCIGDTTKSEVILPAKAKVMQLFVDNWKATRLPDKPIVRREELAQLSTSSNPLLAELRRGRKSGAASVAMDTKQLEDEIWTLQHHVMDLGKKRGELRAMRLPGQPLPGETEKKLEAIEDEMEEAGRRLTKLQMNLNELQNAALRSKTIVLTKSSGNCTSHA